MTSEGDALLSRCCRPSADRCDEPHRNPIVFLLQFQAVARSHGDTDADGGGVDGRSTGRAAVTPVSMTQDRLTLAVLTLLLGGWLALVLTYPVVSLGLMSVCRLDARVNITLVRHF